MTRNGSTPPDPHGGDPSAVDRSLIPVVDRLVDQRHHAAAAEVASLRAQHPEDSPEELADRLIRRYAKDLAMSGAVSGGAAASPVAGMAVAAASVGADAVFNVNRLGEMIMSLGIIYGHESLSVDERRTAVLAVMGIADGAAVGMTGLAARAGARGGARVLRRLPSPAAATTGGVGRRAISKLSSTKGPWSLTSLIPYGIGAGVGAAGNALLARAVGRAAKEYFSGSESPLTATVLTDTTFTDTTFTDTTFTEEIVVEVIDHETELLEPEPGSRAAGDPAPPRSPGGAANPFDDIVDAEIVD